MNEQKNCPLLGTGLYGNCKGDCCAWWAGNTCAVLSLAASLELMAQGGITVEMEVPDHD